MKSGINILLAGQRHFGFMVLESLLAHGYNVSAVAAPLADGKGDRLYNYAVTRRVPVIIPGGMLNSENIPAGVDLIIAAHSYDFISQKTMDKTTLGAIGYHPSLLPLHRGRDAIRWAVKVREPVTGGSVYWLTKNVDAGPVAAQDFCFIRPDDTAETLWRRDLQPMGVRLILKTLADIERGTLVRVPQDETLATWEPSWERSPLFRPDLPRIGTGNLAGYRVKVERTTLDWIDGNTNI